MTAPAWGEYWPTSREHASRSCLATHSEAAGAVAGAASAAADSAVQAIRIRRRTVVSSFGRVLTAPNERRARNWCSLPAAYGEPAVRACAGAIGSSTVGLTSSTPLRMDFRILGPLEVRDHGRSIAV